MRFSLRGDRMFVNLFRHSVRVVVLKNFVPREASQNIVKQKIILIISNYENLLTIDSVYDKKNIGNKIFF